MKHRWTTREDTLLLDAISKTGPHNWSAIALQLPGRNEKQCRERWVNQLRPDMRKGNWTPQEDETIIDMYAQVGSSWSEIAKHVTGRTDQAIKNRYNIYLKPRDGRRAATLQERAPQTTPPYPMPDMTSALLQYSAAGASGGASAPSCLLPTASPMQMLAFASACLHQPTAER